MKRTAVVVGIALALAACGGGSEVGSDELLKFKQGQAGRLGEISKSPSPTKTTRPTPRKTTKTSPAATATRAPTINTVRLEINAQGYKPFNFNIFKGDRLVVTNRDSQARTFTADTGSFDSGMIAPGKTWTYTPKKLGSFNVHDETRPFVVGKMTVVARP